MGVYAFILTPVVKIKKEAEVTTSAPQVQRGKNKESATNVPSDMNSTNYKFASEAGSQDANGATRFKVRLIQEGLGNTGDGYYYTKEALRSAVSVFEGKKQYLDHPSRSEEQDRPERSVKDISGYYENVSYKERDGAGELIADLVIPPQSAFDNARALMEVAIDYSKKFPDQDFVGLSINASGDAQPVSSEDIHKLVNIPASARDKVENAIKDGLNEIKVVKNIDSAVSCDLVTEAGAKGKVLELLEAKAMSKTKMKEDGAVEADDKEKVVPEKKEEVPAEKSPAEQDPAGHKDEQDDVKLIQEMLKKHGLIDDQADDVAKEAAHKAAKHMVSAYEADGLKGQEAYEAAGKAMKCSKAANAAMESEVAESEEVKKKEAAVDKDENKAVKEANKKILELEGKNAKLVETIKKIDLDKHVDSKLKESKLPMALTKKFKEAAKSFKDEKDFDEKFGLFIEGYKADVSGEATEDLVDCVLSLEKETMRESQGSSSLDDCVEE